MNPKSLIKVPLVLAENIIFGIFPRLRPIIERYLFNPLDFKTDHIGYSERKFKEFSTRVPIEKIRDTHILELGPGGSIGFGLLALESGVERYTAIDDGTHTFVEETLLERYTRLLQGNRDALNVYFSLSSTGQASYRTEKIAFATIDQHSRYPLLDASVDIIYSCAVLEHVHNLDLCFAEMSRVLRPGGIMYHEVDLRDHIFSQRSLFFLTLSDYWFRTLFQYTGGYVNRKRVSSYRSLAEKYGLSIVSLEGKNESPEPTIPRKITGLYSKEDLEILSFIAVFSKNDRSV